MDTPQSETTDNQNLQQRERPGSDTKNPGQGNSKGANESQRVAQIDQSSKSARFSPPPPYLTEALTESKKLLKDAIDSGSKVSNDTRDSILQAMAAGSTDWDEKTAANLIDALTDLKRRERARETVRIYFWVAVALAIIIGPFSVISYVTSGISNIIRTDIASGDALAIKLRAELGPPAPSSIPSVDSSNPPKPNPLPASVKVEELISDLQSFGRITQELDQRALQLNWLLLNFTRDPFGAIRENPRQLHITFQLPEGLPDFAAAAEKHTTVYQDVRYFAVNLLENISSFFYGAFTTIILPVLYALLGTCAYLVRSFEHRVSTNTFSSVTGSNLARFLMAGIGGAVVGLFSNFTFGQAGSTPPIAIAFLVGYGVDAFFAFLEGILQTVNKNPGDSQTRQSGGA